MTRYPSIRWEDVLPLIRESDGVTVLDLTDSFLGESPSYVQIQTFKTRMREILRSLEVYGMVRCDRSTIPHVWTATEESS